MLQSLVAELWRRRVFRVMAAYAVVAWVVIEVTDTIFPRLGLPEWTVTLVVVLAFLGLPVAVALAWAFDITPEGVRRTDPQPTDAGARSTPGPGGDWRAQRVAAAAGVLVLALAGTSFVLLGRLHEPPAVEGAEPDRSIAVIPFTNLSDDRENEYFSDGITEDVLTQLTGIADLKVISRTSVMRYKGAEKSLREIARELGVANVLEGSVRREGRHVRITANLVDARTDQSLWSQSFDRELTEIFAIQSEIARQIVLALRARLSPEQEALMERVPTGNLTAYDYYLRGREHHHRLTMPDLDRAIAFYRQAIELDPGFAMAYAGLGVAYTALEGWHGAGAHWLDSALVVADKAMDLDARAPESFSTLATVYWHRGRLAEAVEMYRRGLELRPNDAFILWGLSMVRLFRGELDQALRSAIRAAELEPTAATHNMVARCYWALGDFAAAERWSRSALQLQPDHPNAQQDLIWMFIGSGDTAKAADQLRTARVLLPEAIELRVMAGLLALKQRDYEAARDELEGILRSAPEYSWFPSADLGFAYAKLGQHARARELWQRTTDSAEAAMREGTEEFFIPYLLARTAAAAGDPAEAQRWLEAAYAHGWRGWPTPDISADPLLEGLHAEPQFLRLRSRILDDLDRMRARAVRQDL